MRVEPFAVSEPSAWCRKKSWATPVPRSPYPSPKTSTQTTARMADWRMCVSNADLLSVPVDRGQEQVDQLDENEGGDDPTHSVYPDVAPQDRLGTARPPFDATERERDERHDHQCVEDHRGEHGALRTVQPHDVERIQLRIGRHEEGGDDGEVLRHVVRNRERRERAAGDEQLLSDLDDCDELRRVRVEV